MMKFPLCQQDRLKKITPAPLNKIDTLLSQAPKPQS
ncbi:MAG: hypothetical protein K0R47_3974 [Brevibacillus sp.]|nr:hypothetical protein [Brevibacillus sp.]